MFAGAKGLTVALVPQLLGEDGLEGFGLGGQVVGHRLIVAPDGLQAHIPAVVFGQGGFGGLFGPELVDDVRLLADHGHQGVFAHDVLDLPLVDEPLGQLKRGVCLFHHGNGSFLSSNGSALGGARRFAWNTCIIKTTGEKCKIALWNADMFQM